MKKIPKRLFQIAGILLLCMNARCLLATPKSAMESLFDEANQAYEKGNLGQATTGYMELVKHGMGGFSLAYNLGNLHYKFGERGKAILWYERALRINPRDADAQFNLSLAKSHLKQSDDPIWKKIILLFSHRELGWTMGLFSLLFFGLWGTLRLGWLSNEFPWRSLLGLTGFFFLLSGSWFGAHVAIEQTPLAIVISPPGEVRNGPGLDYAVGFTIPEGTKVLLLSRRPEWCQVGVVDEGLKGWMPAAEVELID